MTLANNFEEILIAFNKHKVEYIIAGGYAVIFHGYGRTTGDLDLWIKPENKINKDKIIQSLRNLNVNEDTLIQLNSLGFTTPIMFIDGEEPFKIDFMTSISGVDFNEAWGQKINAMLDGILIPFINLNHLIISKITTGLQQ